MPYTIVNDKSLCPTGCMWISPTTRESLSVCFTKSTCTNGLVSSDGLIARTSLPPVINTDFLPRLDVSSEGGIFTAMSSYLSPDIAEDFEASLSSCEVVAAVSLLSYTVLAQSRREPRVYRKLGYP